MLMHYSTHLMCFKTQKSEFFFKKKHLKASQTVHKPNTNHRKKQINFRGQNTKEIKKKNLESYMAIPNSLLNFHKTSYKFRQQKKIIQSTILNNSKQQFHSRCQFFYVHSLKYHFERIKKIKWLVVKCCKKMKISHKLINPASQQKLQAAQIIVLKSAHQKDNIYKNKREFQRKEVECGEEDERLFCCEIDLKNLSEKYIFISILMLLLFFIQE